MGTKYTRYESPDGKPGYFKTTGVKEDIKQIVSDVARMVTPRALRERKNDVDDAVRMREGQSTDSNNKY